MYYILFMYPFMNWLVSIYWLRLTITSNYIPNTILPKIDNGQESIKHREPVKQRLYYLNTQCGIVYDMV